MDKIRNELIRGPAHVRTFGDKANEARLRRIGHVQRDEEYVGRKMLGMDLPDRRKRGSPPPKKKGFMDETEGGQCGGGNRRRRRRQSKVKTGDQLCRPIMGTPERRLRDAMERETKAGKEIRVQIEEGRREGYI